MKTLRNTSILTLAVASLALFATQANAGTIPYPNVGTVNPSYSITATGTSIDAWFYGFSAADTDYVQIIDITHPASTGWIFENQTTTPGTELAGVLATTPGDILEFELDDTSYPAGGAVYSSVPGDSPDGINHAYATLWTGGVIPGTSVTPPTGPNVFFLGMEDRPLGNSDLDYNDDQYIFDNVEFTPNPIPEPGPLSLFGTGLLVLAGMLRYKFSKAR